MDVPGPAASPPLSTSETIEDRIGILFDELAFAIRWRRPSILLVPYEIEDLRAAAALALEGRLAALRRPAVPIEVAEQAFDVPLTLSRRPDRGRAIYFVSGLARGGGRDGLNAYKALNMRRELFVDRRIRLVLWLSRAETVALSRHAPDFWAFRHRVVELDDLPASDPLQAMLSDRTDRDWSRPVRDDYLDSAVALREGLLAATGLSDAARVQLAFSLARLARSRGDTRRARALLEQCLDRAAPLGRAEVLAWLWGHLGLVLADLGEPGGALQACQKAVDLGPQEAGPWNCLGEVQLDQRQPEAALQAFQAAVRLSPGEARGWYGLGRLRQQTSKPAEALTAYRKAVRLDSGHAAAWDRLGALYLEMGRPEQALKACKKAVRLAPGSPGFWAGLGQVRYRLDELTDAIMAYQGAAALDPRNPALHANLACLLRLVGQEGPAATELELARSTSADASEYRRAICEVACGRSDRALDLLAEALKKGQAGWASPDLEPAFALLNDDPGFAAVLGQASRAGAGPHRGPTIRREPPGQ
jgi:tetratricopeptide (TPR) repeat protein